MKATMKTLKLARLLRYWRTLNEDPHRVCLLKDFGTRDGRVYLDALNKLGLIEEVQVYVSNGKNGRVKRVGYKVKLHNGEQKVKGGQRKKEWKR